MFSFLRVAKVPRCNYRRGPLPGAGLWSSPRIRAGLPAPYRPLLPSPSCFLELWPEGLAGLHSEESQIIFFSL